jgi:hypothetical protein
VPEATARRLPDHEIVTAPALGRLVRLAAGARDPIAPCAVKMTRHRNPSS